MGRSGATKFPGRHAGRGGRLSPRTRPAPPACRVAGGLHRTDPARNRGPRLRGGSPGEGTRRGCQPPGSLTRPSKCSRPFESVHDPGITPAVAGRRIAIFGWTLAAWVVLTWTLSFEQIAFGAALAAVVALLAAPLGPVAAP